MIFSYTCEESEKEERPIDHSKIVINSAAIDFILLKDRLQETPLILYFI